MNASPGIHNLIIAVLAFGVCSASEAAKLDDGAAATAASVATGSGAGAVPAVAAKPPAADQQAEKQGTQIELARLADEKRKAEDERKRQEIDLLAQQAEEDRRQQAVRLAQERKKKELQRRQAELERRCVIKQVMSDAEIAKCR